MKIIHGGLNLKMKPLHKKLSIYIFKREVKSVFIRVAPIHNKPDLMTDEYYFTPYDNFSLQILFNNKESTNK